MISKGAFKHVESELYAYPDTKKEIERIRLEIMTRERPNDENSTIRSGRIGDPTGQTATLLVTNRKLEQLERVVEAIESVVEKLSNEKKEMMRLWYWSLPRELTWDGVAMKLGKDRSTVIRWRNQIVYLIAEKMGWR